MFVDLIKDRQAALDLLCREFEVQQLDVFGSATTDRFDVEASDLDFVVTFANESFGTLADRYYDFAEALERLFGRPVDLLTERSIQNPVFKKVVERTCQRLYERGHREVIA